MTTRKSGRFGFITDQSDSSNVACLRNWRFREQSNNPKFSDSDSNGHQLSVPGKLSGTVNFDVYYDFDEPLENRFRSGQLVTLQLHRDATRKYTITARVESIESDADVEGDTPQGCACECSTYGPWEYPNGEDSAPADA